MGIWCIIEINKSNTMDYPKSNPNLGTAPSRRSLRRQSRQMRASRQQKQYQFRIQNPFRLGNQENHLPEHIQSQIQNLDYISTKSIKNIQMKGCRTSNFLKNLQLMQELAKKQEQKYTGMINHNTGHTDKQNKTEGEREMLPIGFGDQEDKLSIQLNGMFDDRDRVYEDFNLFQGMDLEQEEPQFYSVQQLEPNLEMEDEVDNYFMP